MRFLLIGFPLIFFDRVGKYFYNTEIFQICDAVVDFRCSELFYSK